MSPLENKLALICTGDLCKQDGFWAQRPPSDAHILTTAPRVPRMLSGFAWTSSLKASVCFMSEEEGDGASETTVNITESPVPPKAWLSLVTANRTTAGIACSVSLCTFALMSSSKQGIKRPDRAHKGGSSVLAQGQQAWVKVPQGTVSHLQDGRGFLCKSTQRAFIRPRSIKQLVCQENVGAKKKANPKQMVSI